MEVNCKIVQDLLPLYAETMLSPESAAAVEDHVAHCESCAGLLAALKQPAQVTETPKEAFQKLSTRIRRRRWTAVAFGVSLTAALLLGLFTWLYQPQYLTAQEAIAGVTEANGIVTVEFTAEAEHFRTVEESSDDALSGSERPSMTIIACSRRWDLLSQGNRILSMDAQQKGRVLMLRADMDIWYASTGSSEEDTLLWGTAADSGRVSLPWLGMRFYLLLGAAGSLLLGSLWLLFRKKKFGRICAAGAVLCISYVFSAWFSTGGSLLIYDPTDKPILFIIAAILAALITGSILSGKQLYDIARNETK